MWQWGEWSVVALQRGTPWSEKPSTGISWIALSRESWQPIGDEESPLASAAALVIDGALPGYFFGNQLLKIHIQTYPIFVFAQTERIGIGLYLKGKPVEGSVLSGFLFMDVQSQVRHM